MIAGRAENKNFAGPAGLEISARLTPLVMYYSLDYLRTAVRQRILVLLRAPRVPEAEVERTRRENRTSHAREGELLCRYLLS